MAILYTWKQKQFDLSSGRATVLDGPAVLHGIFVSVVTSAHSFDLQDGSTVKMTIPASQTAGNQISGGNSEYTTNMVLVPNGSATGKVVIHYQALER